MALSHHFIQDCSIAQYHGKNGKRVSTAAGFRTQAAIFQLFSKEVSRQKRKGRF